MTKREQFTIRLPKGLLDKVREESAIYGDSMNDLMVTAIEKEVRVRAQLRLLKKIEEERQEMARRGLQPDSTPLVRELRMRAEPRG